MTPVIPVFTSHYGQAVSLLTLEKPGAAKPGNPLSVFDLATSIGLKEVYLAEDRIDGFLAAYKVASSLGIKLCYGLKLVICPDISIKDDASVKAESKVVIMARNTAGYHALTRIYSRAWIDGFYYTGRADFKLLKDYWTDDLLLVLPFFSSFISRNTLSFNQIVPDLPAAPWFFKEIQSGLPFAPLIESALDRYIGEDPAALARVIPIKTVYYKDRRDMRAYTVMRAVGNRTLFDAPHVDHLHSDSFCWESFLELAQPAVVQSLPQ